MLIIQLNSRRLVRRVRINVCAHLNAEILKLHIGNRGRGVRHRFGGLRVLREGDHVADVVAVQQQHHETVEPNGQPTMRREAVSQRVKQEAERLLGAFRRKASALSIFSWISRLWIRIEPPPSSSPFIMMS